MKRDPVLLAKLRSMGLTTRGLVWRLGQSLAWAALLRGRAGDVAASGEWHAKAAVVGEALGVEPPPLPAVRDDRVEGTAEALGYVLRTVPASMADGLEPYGDDHLALFECALKLGFLDVLGVGGGDMLRAIGSAVRAAGRRGGLGSWFDARLDAIEAAVGSDRAPELIFETYEQVHARLKGPLTNNSGEAAVAPRASSAESAASPAASNPNPASQGVDSGSRPPAAAVAAEGHDRRRLELFRLCTLMGSALVLHPHPDRCEQARSEWSLARERAEALGLTLPALPDLSGDVGEDARRCLDLLGRIGSVLANEVGRRYGARDRGLCLGAIELVRFPHCYEPGDCGPTNDATDELVASLLSAGLATELWGVLLAVEVALPSKKEVGDCYAAVCNRIRTHLESATG